MLIQGLVTALRKIISDHGIPIGDAARRGVLYESKTSTAFVAGVLIGYVVRGGEELNGVRHQMRDFERENGTPAVYALVVGVVHEVFEQIQQETAGSKN